MIENYSRRIFLASLAALPAVALVVREVFPKERIILYGDGIHDDTKALQAWANGETVYFRDGEPVGNELVGHNFLIRETICIRRTDKYNLKHCNFITMPDCCPPYLCGRGKTMMIQI